MLPQLEEAGMNHTLIKAKDENMSVADQLALSVHHCCHSTTKMLVHSNGT